MEESLFAFDGYEPRRGDYAVLVCRGIASRNHLIGQLLKELRFPSSFGFNWDSFEECLNDLTWIKENRVVLVHEDIPMRTDCANLVVYLSILAHAIDRLQSRRKKNLVVLFQSKDRKELMEIMKTRRIGLGQDA
jgi:hypothetical protein